MCARVILCMDRSVRISNRGDNNEKPTSLKFHTFHLQETTKTSRLQNRQKVDKLLQNMIQILVYCHFKQAL